MSTISKKIIFPTDFSVFANHAFSTAKMIAKLFNAELFILHAIEAPTGITKMFSRFDEKEARKEVDKHLTEFIKRHDDGDVKFNKMVKIGAPYRCISDAAGEISAFMVVMGTHGASGFQEYFVGSNASRVIRDAPCPVMTIRNLPDVEAGFKKLVLPFDLTPESGEKVNWGIDFAQKFGSQINLLSVLMTEDMEVKKKLKARLDKASAFIQTAGVKVEASLITSEKDLPDSVLEYAEQEKADLILIMSQQDKNLKEQLLGAYAAHIVNKSAIAVLSINPTKEYKSKTFSGSHFS